MKKIKRTGFTLIEMTVTLAIFSIVSVAIISGTMQIGKSIEKSRDCVTARQELTVFCQGLYSFLNKSLEAYFWDQDINSTMDYLTKYPTLPFDSVMLNTLILLKDSNGNTGSIVYNPADRTIRWFRTVNATGDVILTNVFRFDDVNATGAGTLPVFMFPHTQELYSSASGTNPKFVVFQFRKRVSDPTTINPNPVTIPVKLMVQLNTIN